MNYILFDDFTRDRLLPFTHTRPVADIRCGILTMRGRWETLLGKKTSTLTENYLQELYPAIMVEENMFINGGILGNETLLEKIQELPAETLLVQGEIIIAARTIKQPLSVTELLTEFKGLQTTEYQKEIIKLEHVWDIFTLNDKAIRYDYELITKNRISAEIPEGVTVTGKENLFIEQGANIYAGCIINAAAGPVYIAAGTEVLEGTLMRGPVAVCEQAVVKMGAKIYGATTIGPGCKVGGELNNVVMFANSNKAHDGYLGNAVIGEWCNLGADTNCSNLKNNYDEIKIWDEAENKSVKTGLIFCGLMMGDHSKCGINTMFNTGTVAGVSCNIFGGGFPEKYIRSFTWGGNEGVTNYNFDRAMETAGKMMARRNHQISQKEIAMYRYIYDLHQKPVVL